ncbi:hypothetical protein ABI59_10855 [Acidobacteria bacterium Mor1]|nr:hypothetical protein ABI59_10855 [Acidobacteria bacterium Mor1]
MSLLADLPLDDLSPARLWSSLPAETRTLAGKSVYSSDWEDAQARKEVNLSIAMAIRFREVAVRKLPVDKRVNYLVKAVRPDDGLAATLLLALHLVERKDMLEAFLNKLGIPNKGGLIDESHDPETPDAETLKAATDHLYESFDDDQVDVYLASLLAMDADAWEGLVEILGTKQGG